MHLRPAPLRMLGGLLALGLGIAPVMAGAQGRPGPAGAAYGSFAMPSDIIAREIAFARAVRDKGQWESFRNFAADDAQMFDGTAPVLVQAWTKGRKDPTEALQWQVHAVWMSCDGTIAATYGAWSAGATHGWFSTLWQRQKKGAYKFILDSGDATAQPLAEPDWIDAKVAECPARRKGEQPPAKADKPEEKGPIDHQQGQSADQTLAWASTLRADGGRDYVLRVKIDGKEQEVLRKTIAAPKR